MVLSLTKNIDTQEQLLNALESLKQHQETINMLKMKAAEEMSNNLQIKDRGGARDEVQQKVRKSQSHGGFQSASTSFPF